MVAGSHFFGELAGWFLEDSAPRFFESVSTVRMSALCWLKPGLLEDIFVNGFGFGGFPNSRDVSEDCSHALAYRDL